jgi:hypothetical protein
MPICFLFFAASSLIIQDPNKDGLGRMNITTLLLPPNVTASSATYLTSGQVLVTYSTPSDPEGTSYFNIAVMNDDGSAFRNIFSGDIPQHPKANGIRFMPFRDNIRVHLGDYILECPPSLDLCTSAQIIPVDYPWDLEDDPLVMNHWSEIIIAPDNVHVAWTILRTDIGAAAGLGSLHRTSTRYSIEKAQVISTIGMSYTDTVYGGEVKQFVRGGTAISLVGSKTGALADSVVQDLESNSTTQITFTPGYDETTIFSPDEQLGLTMTSRFSPLTDPAVFGLLPRPHALLATHSLIRLLYTYAVQGVRSFRPGNVGPALIEIRRSIEEEGYKGVPLYDTEGQWVYESPMSWHPGGRKGMWPETFRGGQTRRIRVAELLDYTPGPEVPPKVTSDFVPYGLPGSALKNVPPAGGDARISGNVSGYIEIKNGAEGWTQWTTMRYVRYSDDGKTVYNGFEKTYSALLEESTYEADVEAVGEKEGEMKLKATFSSLVPSPRLIFEDGKTSGYARYKNVTLHIEDMLP